MIGSRFILACCLLSSGVQATVLSITIEPRFDGGPVTLDSLRYKTAANETISITRLSYIVSGFALEKNDGRWIEFPGTFAWLDSASRRNAFQVNGVPKGSYRSMRFHIGPDTETNAFNVGKFPADHPLNPNLNGLHWSWQGGFIFMAVEGRYSSGTNPELKGYAYHLARNANRTRIDLNTALDLNHDAGALIHLNLASLLNAPRPLSLEQDGSATHSRDGDPIAAALVANLPGAFRLIQVTSLAPIMANRAPVTPIDLPDQHTPFRFTMSRTFPIPDLPRDNPLITERVDLGKKLFHDPMLSRNGTISCATCHQADAAFTDRLPVSKGIEGRQGERNAMPLFNLAWKREFFWDGRAKSLREQVLMPITDHREMDESLENVCSKLSASAEYRHLFSSAYKSPGIDGVKVSLALEQFLLTQSARDSRFDRAMSGKPSLTDAEKRGFELFMSEYEPRTGQYGADCFHCHGGALFSDHQFHNNGLSGNDPGRSKVTGAPADVGKFSTPSLRNIELTAPYMHDGRFATLEEIIEHYSSGVHRGPTLDSNLAKHPEKGLNLNTADKAALVAFLKTLTDEESPPP